ncbi:protein of unknown function (plasmid) [Caballeronia sp. S22]
MRQGNRRRHAALSVGCEERENTPDNKVRRFGSVATVSRSMDTQLTLHRIIRDREATSLLIPSLKWTMQAIVL